MSSKVLCFKISDEKDLMHCFWSFSDGYFFRGHANAKWLLQTTLERRYSDYHKESFKTGILEHHIEKKEEKYFSNAFCKDLTIIGEYAAIQKYCRLNSLPIPDGKNFAVEVLAKMQHYGAATRLLDVTTSFLIALFFSFEEYGEQDRAVWIFNGSFFYKNSGIIQERTNWDTKEEEDRIFLELMNNKSELRKCCGKYADEFIYAPQHSLNTKTSIVPLEIIGNNPRLVAQNGAFLFPTKLNKSFEENLCTALGMTEQDFSAACKSISRTKIKNFDQLSLINAAVIKLIIPVKIRHLAERLFNAANISYQSIYPDEIGIAKSIKYW